MIIIMIIIIIIINVKPYIAKSRCHVLYTDRESKLLF